MPNSQFAVVEYNSKSGTVWRHSADRPNYLADPIKEIDPTSFGCYVSAMQGEHIPLTGLVIGPVQPVSVPLKLYRQVVKRLTGSWPTNYSLEYLRACQTLLVVHQLSDAHEMACFVKRLNQELPHLFIIGVPTQPFGILKKHIDQDMLARRHLVEFIDSCHVFFTVVKDTADWYRRQTDTPVVYMPQPYPAAFASDSYRPLNQKDKIIIVAGVTQRDNIKQGQQVARQLQQEFPEYNIYIPQVPDLEYDSRELNGANYKIHPFETWQTHLKTIARAALVINTDYTFTRGRVQTDCAAVGTPSLGANSDGQRDLYPDLYSRTPQTTDTLIAQARHLLTDNNYYNQVTKLAQSRLAKYDYAPTAQRLNKLMKQYQH